MEELKDHPLIERGIATGREQGMAAGQAKMLLSQWRLKFGDLPEGAQGQVATASSAQVEAWAAAVLTASSLDEVLATTPSP